MRWPSCPGNEYLWRRYQGSAGGEESRLEPVTGRNEFTDDFLRGSRASQFQPYRPTSRRVDSESEKGTANTFKVYEFCKLGHSTRNRLEPEADAVGQLTTFSGFLRETLQQFLSDCELSLA